MMLGMRALFAAIAICGALPAWGQDEPKATLPIFREAPGALAHHYYAPASPPEELAQVCKAKCDKPCANWARSQTDYQFSYEACETKCRKIDNPWCP